MGRSLESVRRLNRADLDTGSYFSGIKPRHSDARLTGETVREKTHQATTSVLQEEKEKKGQRSNNHQRSPTY